ncbi:MAG: uncharacterized protein KVP18_001682 [Porospora cf. gigantea A]|uniref:uncharacterized protein n=1 Tax=Porospora cf. gigantea A TaxID=2853593 RepID=UPI00355A2D16|nr:MAG: hypothetical protein KVP18_001682 [Porospora cf. gigantea A]
MSSELQLRNLSRLHGRVQIFRRSSTYDHPAEDLVPGDVFEVHKGMVLPCDAVLLDGAVVVDESQLTGESVAISKQAVCRKSDRLFDWDADATSVLYSGTKLLDVKSKQHQSRSYAICARTGFDTLRGSMIYSIMFAPSSRYDFESDVFRFVQVLACGATVVAVLTFIKEYLRKKPWKEVVIMSLDPVTCVVPPALPAAITGALSLSLASLRSKWDVRCVHPKHIMAAGQVSTVVFDKTGTLTEEGIHYHGVIPVLRPPFALSCKTLRNDTVASSVYLPARIEALKPEGLGALETDVGWLVATNPMLLMAMATCHELSIVEGDLQGDDHDRCLFEASGWEIAEEGRCTLDADGLPGAKELFLAPPKTEWFVSMRPRGRQRLVTMIAEGLNLDELADTMAGRQRCPAFESMRISRSVEMGRLRVYSLDHSLHRMTVVVRDLFTKQCYCFVKGAPESILDICLPSSVPELTETTIQSYASRGARLLGLAGRPLGPLTPSAVDRLARVDLEHKMIFLGLGIFENKPKEGVKEALHALHEAHVRPLMATGDNPRTAIAVSRQTCLLPPCIEDVIIGDLHGVHSDRVVWAKVAYAPDDGTSSDSDWLNTALRHRHTTFDLQDYIVGQQMSKLTVALTGRAFRKVQEWHLRLGLTFYGDEHQSRPLHAAASVHPQDSTYLAAKHMLPPAVSEWMMISCARNRRRLRSDPEAVEQEDLLTISLFEFILRHGRVFSRMTPDDKALLVTSLQSLPRSPLIGMVGDGANDCAALKVADLSVSVGSAETSLAASFTSERASLRSVLDVMREGRAALANGFVQVRFVLLYSMMQYAMCEILFFNGTYITDQMFLVQDLFVIVPLSFLISITPTSDTLTRHVPGGSLTSLSALVGILGQVVVQCSLFLFAVVTLLHHEKATGTPRIVESFERTDLSTILFTLCHLQIVLLGVVFHEMSYPWRRLAFFNHWLMFFAGFMYAAGLVVAFPLSVIGLGDVRFRLQRLLGMVVVPNFGPSMFRILTVSLLATLSMEGLVRYLRRKELTDVDIGGLVTFQPKEERLGDMYGVRVHEV